MFFCVFSINSPNPNNKAELNQETPIPISPTNTPIKKRYNFDSFCAILYDENKVAQYNRLLEGFGKIKLEKALKLADMIFDTETDKYYFLKQYLKLFKAESEYIKGLVK